MLVPKNKEVFYLSQDSNQVSLETSSNKKKTDEIIWLKKDEDLLKKEKIFKNLPINIQNILGYQFINNKNITVEKMLAICWWDELIINDFWKENLLSEHMTVNKIRITHNLWNRRIKAINWKNIAKQYMTVEKITILLYQNWLDINKIIAIGWENLASASMTPNKIITIRDYLSVEHINSIWWLLLTQEELSEEYIKFIWLYFSSNEINIFWIENIIIWINNNDKNNILNKKKLLLKLLRKEIINLLWWLLIRNNKVDEKTIIKINSLDKTNNYSNDYLLYIKKMIINNDNDIILYF